MCRSSTTRTGRTRFRREGRRRRSRRAWTRPTSRPATCATTSPGTDPRAEVRRTSPPNGATRPTPTRPKPRGPVAGKAEQHPCPCPTPCPAAASKELRSRRRCSTTAHIYLEMYRNVRRGCEYLIKVKILPTCCCVWCTKAARCVPPIGFGARTCCLRRGHRCKQRETQQQGWKNKHVLRLMRSQSRSVVRARFCCCPKPMQICVHSWARFVDPAGNPLDRVNNRRKDVAFLAAQLESAASVCIPFHRLSPLLLRSSDDSATRTHP